MTEPIDTSLEAQFTRNFRSDMRGLLGCQLALPIFSMFSFLPIALLYPFTYNSADFFLANFFLDIVLAISANIYWRKAPEHTLRRAVAAWLVVLAPCFAMMFLVLWLGETFSI